MCQFKSGVILFKHRKVLHDYIENSHSVLLEEAGIKDDCIEARFVRVELIPLDGDICNKDKANWKLKVDQDHIPDWFDEEKAFKQMWRALKDTWDNAFIIDKTVGELKDKKIYLIKNATIKSVYGSATIKSVYGSATINDVYGSATINDVSDSATINYVYGSATINDVSGSATINYVSGSATINYVSGSATIKSVYGSATINYVYGSATINDVSDSATINDVSGSATIKSVYGSATYKKYDNKAGCYIIYRAPKSKYKLKVHKNK
jgi:DUF4097 and DUF4098 domain-containing protein YvlB